MELTPEEVIDRFDIWNPIRIPIPKAYSEEKKQFINTKIIAIDRKDKILTLQIIINEK